MWLPSFKEPKDMKEDLNTDRDRFFFLLIYKMLQFCSKDIKFKTTFILIATKLFRKIVTSRVNKYSYMYIPFSPNRTGAALITDGHVPISCCFFVVVLYLFFIFIATYTRSESAQFTQVNGLRKAFQHYKMKTKYWENQIKIN